MPANNRPTIGFLLASLHTGASRALLPGVMDAAQKRDVNLVCFPGGRLGVNDAFEIQRNKIYDLAGEDCLDGLITWSSALGGVVGPAEVNAFHQRYRPLTMVSLAQFMEGMPTVSVDSYLGMRALLTHLIEEHGYQRLAFIRGPEGHYYAQERYRAYLDALKYYNLPFIPELVTEPLRWEAGAKAVEILLDQRHLRPGTDFQAVVAVSDMLALWVLKTLQARGYKVPEDVAVTGFNNSIEERLATPPLTTVDSPMYHQGAKAVEMLLAQWTKESVPALITLPCSLVVRQSCGCSSIAVKQSAYEPPSGTRAEVDEPTREKLLSPDDYTACLFEMSEAASPGECSEEAAGKLLTAFLDETLLEQKKTKAPNFLETLENLLDQAIRREGQDLTEWHGVISALRRRVIARFPLAGGRKARVESLLAQARIVISEAIQRSYAYRQWIAERRTENLRETTRALLTTFDLQGLIAVLCESLPGLEIPGAYLVLYEDAEQTEYGTLVMAYSDEIPAASRVQSVRFAARQLVPADFLPKRRRYSMVVEPLFFQNKPLGYIVFEMGPREGSMYELLRANLSSALQGALLFKEIQQARITAEKADRIKTRLLANVSHELRTPLNIIVDRTQHLLKRVDELNIQPELKTDILHIQNNAEHQLRVINDLLDLSRAEIDELDLYFELIDPRSLLVDAFESIAGQGGDQTIDWQLDLPERLPIIRADALRLRQIILNLLSNARKFTPTGRIALGAEVAPPDLHIWVADTGMGIVPDQQERIFEPFVTIEDNRRISSGIGLGLSITRHLVALHRGQMSLESEVGAGSTFHIRLPLPALEQQMLPAAETHQPVLLLISSSETLAPEIIAMSSKHKLELRVLHDVADLEHILSGGQPVAVAWDLNGAKMGDWGIVRQLRHYPGLSQAPFILYGQMSTEESQGPQLISGLTGFAVKSPNPVALIEVLNAICPAQSSGPLLVVDDDPQARAAHAELVRNQFPGCDVQIASSGEEALAAMQISTPALVLLDYVMPGMSGADVLDQMRADPKLRQVSVIILSNKVLSYEDAKRLEVHNRVTFQSKGMWSDAETASALHRALFGNDALPAHTSALVKHAIAYFHQNYSRALSRWEIASAVGVSEDYLSRVFSRELGLSPWDYLNRYRVLQSKILLQNTTQSVGVIARQVGFNDPPYFSRVFHKVVGVSPQQYRDGN